MNTVPDVTTLPKPLRVDPRRSAQLDRALARLRPAPDAPGEFGPATTEYRRELKRLITARELRAAAKTIAAARAEWHAANAAAQDIDPALWAYRQRRYRAKARSMLAGVFANYAAIQKLRSSHAKRLRTLAQLWRSRMTGLNGANAWGGPPPAVGDPDKVFTQFTAEKVWQDCWPENSINPDNSLARAGIGTVINNFIFDQDDDTWTLPGGLSLPGFRSNTSLAAVGVDYKMPRAGALRVAAQIVNYYNRITMSLSDNTGISSANMHVTPSLFIAVARLDEMEMMDKLLFVQTMDDEDSSWFSILPDMESSYAWERISSTHFDKNETVTIFVGCKVYVNSSADDMRARVNALLWWQLKKLSVWVS